MIETVIKPKGKPYFLSFVEEGIFNPDYFDYAGGRIEVYDDKHEYDIDEIRFLTPRKDFYPFREKYDFTYVSKKELEALEKIVKEKYYKPKEE